MGRQFANSPHSDIRVWYVLVPPPRICHEQMPPRAAARSATGQMVHPITYQDFLWKCMPFTKLFSRRTSRMGLCTKPSWCVRLTPSPISNKGTDITFLKIVYYLNKYLHQQLRINQMFSYTRHRSKSDISNRKGRSRAMTLVRVA